MRKPWSISTTVRTPERIPGFLTVLKKLEGERFDSNNQIKYQVLLIKHRLYRPTKMTPSQKEYFENFETDMPYSVAEDIFNSQDYIDPAMRGRNSVAPLNKMGLCIAKSAADSIRITNLGNQFLLENYDLGKVFFYHFLKWQLPNPDSRTFSANAGFSIIPFIGTLHLIRKVNELLLDLGNHPTGITKEEFSLFVPTLIHHQDISSQAARIIDFRTQLNSLRTTSSKNSFRTRYIQAYASEFLETEDSTANASLIKNLKDYGDNTIRYFRLTRYIFIRGGGFYIDLEPRRSIEIGKLLETYDASPKDFNSPEEYIEYLADINQPVLPWQTETELRRIAQSQRADIDSLIVDLGNKSVSIPTFQFIDTANLNIDALNQYVDSMRSFRTSLQELELHVESQNISKIEEYIEALRTIHSSPKKKSIELERLVTLALIALNDALTIKPNYPVGDDNQPTFTAPANKPDIECFYNQFNSVCEVTMLTTRSQWYNEGQPVMRHVRDFENAYAEKDVYCLFIAPRLHQDTIETFWYATKHGYRNDRQRIVPFSITQFIRLLEALLEIRRQGRSFTHEKLLNLYDAIIALADNATHSDQWINGIPGAIEDWKSSMLGSS